MPTMFLALKMSTVPFWVKLQQDWWKKSHLTSPWPLSFQGDTPFKCTFSGFFVGLYFSVAHLFKHLRGKFKPHSLVAPWHLKPLLLLYPPQLLCNFPPLIGMFFLSSICPPYWPPDTWTTDELFLQNLEISNRGKNKEKRSFNEWQVQ